MPFYITSKPVKVRIDGHDSEGRLIFADDQLSAVIVRLAPPTFSTPEEAEAWVQQRLAGE
jgi:hypothetical protein